MKGIRAPNVALCGYLFSGSNDRWQCLEEWTDDPGEAPGMLKDYPNCRYVWGARYVDELILRQRDTNVDGTIDDTFYALQDANFNVVALALSNGTIEERFIYDAYGKVTPKNSTFGTYSGTDYEWEFLYTGRRLDLESSIMYHRNRYYHTSLGRFVSRDPIGYEGSAGSLYAYVGSMPLRFVDPSGLFPGGAGTMPLDYYDQFKPKPTPGASGSNADFWLEGYVFTCFCDDKDDRLKPIPGVVTPPRQPSPPRGPDGGDYSIDPYLTKPPSAVGGSGAATCHVLVVKCQGSVSVFHFSVGDDPDATLEQFNWPSDCEAIMCGGNDEPQSNCLGDDVVDAAEHHGLTLVGVSGNSGCGVDANGDWCQFGN